MLLLGDCRDSMAFCLGENEVDAIVTDPPYDLTAGKKGGTGMASVNLESPYGRARIGVGNGSGGFMGLAWDSTGVAFDPETWRQCLRVLKPGGHLLAFGGTRTYHRMVCAIEDAGFEIRDQIGWVYGSGFPKSLDVSKAIDKAAGAERASRGGTENDGRGSMAGSMNSRCGQCGKQFFSSNACECPRIDRMALTDDARQWQGWGTALKPAWEPIVVARKPLIGTVAANVLAHGTGALNIDGCRVPVDDDSYARNHSGDRGHAGTRGAEEDGATNIRAGGGSASKLGRWPANLIHDGSDEVIALFPQSDGQLAAVRPDSGTGQKTNGILGKFATNSDHTPRGDAGSAARFFASFPQETPCHEPPSSAPIAAPTSSLQSVLDASVASAAATWPSLAGILSSGSTEPSTIATAPECETLHETVTAAMASIGCGFSLVSRLEKRTHEDSLVSVAARIEQTGTTTITTGLYRSDGSVGRATSTITPTPLDRGEADCARFRYCAKASRTDRNESPGTFQAKGTDRSAHNSHPTVKPTALMRYLCRLVTPPGGTVLDPFMGSGSTGRGAVLEGFKFIGCEMSLEYLTIAQARIAVAAAKGPGA